MGRVGVDIYPLQTGVGLEDVETFGKFLGGSATNVAVAAARHGEKSAVITRTCADPFGRFVHRALGEFGVDDPFVTAVPELPTPVTFCERFRRDDFPIWFYRYPKAPDLEIKPEEIPVAEVQAARLFWATVTGLCAEPSRAAHHAAWRARSRSPLTVLDLDYRPVFWASREQAREQVQAALPHVTVAVGNLDEVDTAVGTRDARAAAEALLEAGGELAVGKRGPGGVYARAQGEGAGADRGAGRRAPAAAPAGRRRAADDRRGGSSGPWLAGGSRGRQRDGRPLRPAAPPAGRAEQAGRGRAAGHRGHHRGPAAAGRAGGQGGLRLDEPRRAAGGQRRARRPVHRLRPGHHRGHGAGRREDAAPDRP